MRTLPAIPADFLITVCLVLLLSAVTIIDIRQFRIPTTLNAALLGLGLMSALVLGRMEVSWSLFSAAFMYGVGVAIRETFQRVRGYVGLGLGDVKFVAAAASLVGLGAMPLLVLIASLTALSAVAVNRMAGDPLNLDARIFFGPFLSAALLAMWLFPYFSN